MDLKLFLFLVGILVSFSTLSVYATVPDPPIVTNASPVFNSAIEFGWQNPVSNVGGLPISGFYVYRMADHESAFREMPFSSDPASYWKFDGPTTGLTDYGSNSAILSVTQGSDEYADDNNGEIGQSLDLDGSTNLQLVNPTVMPSIV